MNHLFAKKPADYNGLPKWYDSYWKIASIHIQNSNLLNVWIGTLSARKFYDWHNEWLRWPLQSVVFIRSFKEQ